MKRMLVLIAVMALAGCATQPKLVHLQFPPVEHTTENGKSVFIDAVTDVRDFSVLPESSSPKLSPKFISKLGQSNLDSSIFGLPNGRWTMVLADKSSVADEVRQLVSDALQSRGYHVVPADAAKSDAAHINIRVTEFWCYFPFSLGRALTWTQQMKALITTEISVTSSGKERKFSVSGYGANIVQVLNEENVSETYYKAMTDYSRNLESKLFSSL